VIYIAVDPAGMTTMAADTGGLPRPGETTLHGPVRHAPEPPVLEIGGGQPPQPDDHIDRRDNLAACENRGHRALYLGVHRIAAERIDRHTRLG